MKVVAEVAERRRGAEGGPLREGADRDGRADGRPPRPARRALVSWDLATKSAVVFVVDGETSRAGRPSRPGRRAGDDVEVVDGARRRRAGRDARRLQPLATATGSTVVGADERPEPMFLSDLSIKRPVFATVLMLALVTLGALLLPAARRSTCSPTSRSRSSPIIDRVPRRLARDRRARGDEADRGGGQPDLRRQARLLDLARGALHRRRRVRPRGEDQRRVAGGPRQDQRDPQRAPRGDRGAGHPEARHRRDADRLARGPLRRRSTPARADDARRPEGQAPPREHPGRRQGRPGRRARSARSTSIIDPARLDALGTRRRRGDRRALGART